MKRTQLIIDVWDYGIKHPNFSIDELKDYLKKNKSLSDEDISFGIAYVKKNFIKSRELDEYLIDQDSITGYLTNKQLKKTTKANIIAIITLVLTIFSVIWQSNDYFNEKSIDEKVVKIDDTSGMFVTDVTSQMYRMKQY